MKIITPGLAQALTPHDWTEPQLRRREREPRSLVVPLARLRVRVPHLRLPTVPVRHRIP